MRRRDPSSQKSPADSTITIMLKSLRNPPISLTLPSQPLSTSVVDLKSAIAKEVKAKSIEGVKILHNKKPCVDSKTVKDFLGEEEVPSEIEFSVMIMGGVAATENKAEAGNTAEGGEKKDVDQPPAAQGPSGDEVLESEEFWNDLKGFLSQRLKNDGKAEEVTNVFRQSWKGKGGGWKWGGMGMKGWSKS
ncbi:MAG: hypothetical protein Q9191_003237 [Dirinaria sp. TL-2023a]